MQQEITQLNQQFDAQQKQHHFFKTKTTTVKHKSIADFQEEVRVLQTRRFFSQQSNKPTAQSKGILKDPLSPKSTKRVSFDSHDSILTIG